MTLGILFACLQTMYPGRHHEFARLVDDPLLEAERCQGYLAEKQVGHVLNVLISYPCQQHAPSKCSNNSLVLAAFPLDLMAWSFKCV